MKAYQNDHLYCLHNALPSKLGSNTLNFDSKNITYMYAYSGIFWGRNFHEFWSLWLFAKVLSSKFGGVCLLVAPVSNLWKFIYYAKIFFPHIRKSFLLYVYDICFCPQHLSIPLLDKALFFENCWLMFTFCSVQTNLFT